MKDYFGVYDYQRRPCNKEKCSNCNTRNWGAKNEDYCNHCEQEFMEIFYRVFSREHNPLQDFADAILKEVQGHGR